MGKGIDMARADAPEHAAVMDDFKDQLLIVLIKRLADKDGKLVIPVAETDDTGGDLLAFNVEGLGTPTPAFHFYLEKKQ
jgi:hypothetical protein